MLGNNAHGRVRSGSMNSGRHTTMWALLSNLNRALGSSCLVGPASASPRWGLHWAFAQPAVLLLTRRRTSAHSPLCSDAAGKCEFQVCTAPRHD